MILCCDVGISLITQVDIFVFTDAFAFAYMHVSRWSESFYGYSVIHLSSCNTLFISSSVRHFRL